MPEAVIVATARTPIGRAFKGSFTEERADDMAAFIVDAVLNKVPQLDRNTVDDLILGCGLPGGEQGFNMGRVVAILAGMPDVPGCTITRYCSSSLQSIRMAAHAVRAGDFIYVSGQGPIDPATNDFSYGTIEHETRIVLNNLKLILEAAGASIADVVKCSVFLRDGKDFAAIIDRDLPVWKDVVEKSGAKAE